MKVVSESPSYLHYRGTQTDWPPCHLAPERTAEGVTDESTSATDERTSATDESTSAADESTSATDERTSVMEQHPSR